MVRPSVAVVVVLAGLMLASSAVSQGREGFIGSFNDPAIDYLHAPLTDRVSTLARRLDDGSAHLTFDSNTGYLLSVLQQLEIALIRNSSSIRKPACRPP